MNTETVVVITGMSGSGKHTVFKAFEDIGFFCVDNLPIPLVPRLLELGEASGGQIPRLAVVVDVRLGEPTSHFKRLFTELKARPFRTVILFVEASDEALVRRYSETRRLHPLAHDKSILEGLEKEREELREIRNLADIVVDTSATSVHDLRNWVNENFRTLTGKDQLVISVVSFGFKYGVPYNADMVLDVRFLPNPHFVPELKPKTGKDVEVATYMNQFEDTRVYLQKVSDLLLFMVPRVVQEGKSYLTVAIGCTGGRHRSVMVAAALEQALRGAGHSVQLAHRDIHRGE